MIQKKKEELVNLNLKEFIDKFNDDENPIFIKQLVIGDEILLIYSDPDKKIHNYEVTETELKD